MRLLFLGDVVGRAGRKAVYEALPKLIDRYRLDFVIVNGENAAGGFGITEAICDELLAAGADCVTLGNHAFDQKEALVFIARQPKLIRPLNFPKDTPGAGTGLFQARNGMHVMVINALGRVFMTELDCPFRAIDAATQAFPLGKGADVSFIDFHAEATSEKQALAYFLDGRVTAITGTHTHAPTSDHRVLPKGTAYVSDTGMCGDYNSVLGMDTTEPVHRFLTRIPRGRFEPSDGPATVSGFCVDVDDATGLARACAPLRLGGVLAPAEPQFWL